MSLHDLRRRRRVLRDVGVSAFGGVGGVLWMRMGAGVLCGGVVERLMRWSRWMESEGRLRVLVGDLKFFEEERTLLLFFCEDGGS